MYIFFFQPCALWSGKQVIGVILRPNKKCQIKINLRTKGKSYTENEELCIKDSCKRNSKVGIFDLESRFPANFFYETGINPIFGNGDFVRNIPQKWKRNVYMKEKSEQEFV